MTRTRREVAAHTPGAATSNRKRTSKRAPVADPVNAAHATPGDHPVIAAVVAALAQYPPKALADAVGFLSDFAGWPPKERACLILLANPTLSDTRIAAMVGVSRTTLYTWPEYVRRRRALKVLPTLPRGSVDEDGHIEAWDG